MILPDLSNPEGRRSGAFLALVGGSIVNSAFAAVVLYMVRSSANLAFWLGIVAQAQVLVVLTALGALLVKRTVKVSREGIEISDEAEAAQTVADAAQTEASAIKDAKQ